MALISPSFLGKMNNGFLPYLDRVRCIRHGDRLDRSIVLGSEDRRMK